MPEPFFREQFFCVFSYFQWLPFYSEVVWWSIDKFFGELSVCKLADRVDIVNSNCIEIVSKQSQGHTLHIHRHALPELKQKQKKTTQYWKLRLKNDCNWQAALVTWNGCSSSTHTIRMYKERRINNVVEIRKYFNPILNWKKEEFGLLLVSTNRYYSIFSSPICP